MHARRLVLAFVVAGALLSLSSFGTSPPSPFGCRKDDGTTPSPNGPVQPSAGPMGPAAPTASGSGAALPK